MAGGAITSDRRMSPGEGHSCVGVPLCRSENVEVVAVETVGVARTVEKRVPVKILLVTIKTVVWQGSVDPVFVALLAIGEPVAPLQPEPRLGMFELEWLPVGHVVAIPAKPTELVLVW